jgi:hypothetical protein
MFKEVAMPSPELLRPITASDADPPGRHPNRGPANLPELGEYANFQRVLTLPRHRVEDWFNLKKQDKFRASQRNHFCSNGNPELFRFITHSLSFLNFLYMKETSVFS